MRKTRDLFKKIRNTKGRFQAKMGTKRTEMVWTQQKRKLLRRGDKNTQKNYTKKDFHHPDNCNGVITNLVPDILKCEVKWALESITTNKASGIPVELFQILIDDAVDDVVKVLHSNMPANLENSAGATGLEKVNFHSNPEERQCQRMLKLPHNFTHLTC